MADVKIKVTGAVVNGQPSGSILEVDEASADKLVSIGYAEIVKEEKKPAPRKKKADEKNDDK